MKLIITLSFLLTLYNITNAQGTSNSIYSETLKENRILEIILPAGYKPESKEKYDVAYLLDGKDNVKLFAQIQEFAEQGKYTPKLIIVAVYNTDRNRDFTPTPSKNLKTSGGAEKFLSFFKQELIPYINKAYSTSGQNLLCGHSLGGLFTMYALLKEPALFSSYVAMDPSFWYDDNYMIKLAIEKLNDLSGPEKSLYISGRGDAMKDMGISMMDSVLQIKAPKDLFFKVVPYENETHHSVKLKSMYDGLKFSYEGYHTKDRRIEYYPMNGIVLKNKPYVIFDVSGFMNSRYTTGSLLPTPASPEFKEKTTLSGPAKLSIKVFTPKGRYDKTATGNFILGEAPAPIAKPAKYQPGGLSYSYYEGKWDKIPNFERIKPVQSGIADKEFTFRKLPSKTNFACLFEGLIEIKDDGYYIFSIDSDDGAKLYLKNKLLIDYDGVHAGMQSQSFQIPLKRGFYPVKIEYFQQEGYADLRFKYMLPGGKELIDIPHELLYSKNR